MVVRIGVQDSPKELDVDLGDGVEVDAIQKEVEKVLSDGSKVLWLTDKKGRKVAIASAKIAYVEIDTQGDDRKMGFIG